MKNVFSNLKEIITDIQERLLAEDIEAIRSLQETEIPSLHFGLGLMIRNNYIYNKSSAIGQALLREIGDADGISTVVLYALWHHLQGVHLTKQIIQKLISERFWIVTEQEAEAMASQLVGSSNDKNA